MENIKYHTRTVTTAIALETGKGEFVTGIALGLVLFCCCFNSKYCIINVKKGLDSMSYLYKLKNVEQYYDDKKVLNIDHLTLEDNQIIGLFGPNGSGKSTFIISFIFYK